MRRGQQANAGAQVVRAVAQARGGNAVDDTEHPRHAAPLGEIGLDNGDGARRDQRVEGLVADRVFTGGQWNRRRLGQALPLAPGSVGAQRLFEPGRRRSGEPARHPEGRVQVPRLVGIDHHGGVASSGGAHGGEVLDVARLTEANLQLERRVAGGTQRGHRFARPLGVDAARIDGHLTDDRRAFGRRGTGEMAPKRQAGAPRREVVHRDVEARDRLRDRAGLACLQGQHGGLERQLGPGGGRRRERSPDHERREQRLDQPGAMFRPARRKVAPRFAPAVGALLVLDAQQHGRPVEHGAEGGAYRHPHRPAQHMGFKLGDGRRQGAFPVAGGHRFEV